MNNQSKPKAGSDDIEQSLAEGVLIRLEAQTTTDWSEPDKGLLTSQREYSPKFPLDGFPAPFRQWIMAAARMTTAPVDYVAGALLVCVAGLIGTSRQASPWSGWKEYAILWLVLVGAPSRLKTPALNYALRPIGRIEQKYLEEWRSEINDWEKRKYEVEVKGGWFDEKKPFLKRITISDCTTEKKVRLLAENPKGLIESSDELSGLMGQQDRYGGGGIDRSFGLSAYSGVRYSLDRVKLKEPIVVERAGLSRIGGLQPDKLSVIVGGADDGHSGRHLFMAPGPVPVERPPEGLQADDEMAQKAFEKLDKLDFTDDQPVCKSFSDDAAACFEAWWKPFREKADSLPGQLGGIYGKMPGQVVRLALVIAYMHWAIRENEPEPQVIGKPEVKAAIKLVEDYFRPTVEHLLDAEPEEMSAARALARKIMKSRPQLITSTEIRCKWRLDGLSNAKAVMAAVEILLDAGWLRWAEEATGVGARRKKEWLVNPKVYQDEPASNRSNATNGQSLGASSKTNGAQTASNGGTVTASNSRLGRLGRLQEGKKEQVVNGSVCDFAGGVI